MQISSFLRVATTVLGLGLGLLLSACGSSGTSTAGGDGESPSTTAAVSGASTTTPGEADGGSTGGDTDGDLCAAVPADQVAGILGQDIAAAQPLKVSDRFRSQGTLPGCTYVAEPSAAGTLMVVSAEFLECSEAEGVFTDPVAKRTELSGVGDRAMARADATDSTLFIDVITEKGDQCLYVRIFQGAPEAQTKELTNALLGG